MKNRFVEDSAIDSGTALAVMRRSLRFVWPFRGRITVKLLLLLVGALPGLLLPWPIKVLIDNVIDGRPVADPLVPYPAFIQPFMNLLVDLSITEILWAVIGAQLILLFLSGSFGTAGNEQDNTFAGLAEGYDTATRSENEANLGWSFSGGLLGILDYCFTLRLTQAFNHHYRARLFRRIQTLPMTAFDDERIGDAVYRVMYDTPTITNACYRIILTPIAVPVVIALNLSAMAVAFSAYPFLVWTGLSAVPIALLATVPFAGMLRRRSGESRQAGATTTSTAEEGVSHVLAVQSLGGEKRQLDHFERDSWDSFGRFRSVVVAVFLAIVAGTVLGAAVGFYVFWRVSGLVIEGALSPGDFTVLFYYYVVIATQAGALGQLWFQLQGNAAGLHRVFFMMDQPGEDDAASRELAPLRETIRIEDVHYRYPDGTHALKGVGLEARVGERIALVGPAGAGKTTLAYLLPRFLEPSSGRVLFDDQDIANVSHRDLREQTAFVFQENALFDATVEENIRIGHPGASDTQVRQAAQTAGADEFIARLPQGYQTPLGRGGGKLSVGQKQRLAIARALVRDARVLILDEPTSALDPETEQRLVEALREASRNRVVFVVAHRLSTIRSADQICFIDDGRIVERGSHDELMAREDGAYRSFVELQARGAA
ncbi:MAG: ABC transporter ATP-binding protein [Myxococcota bacterium]|nr:ABC transporter ATP-binding protein [Myxococcota bacterium]